jgi:hypothetical protein
MTQDFHKDFDSIKTVAVHYAKEHNCKYNIILHNPNENGQFGEDSTYEFVTDSYFNKERPNDILVEVINPTYTIDEVIERNSEVRNLINTFSIKNDYIDYLDSYFIKPHRIPTPQYIRETPKIGRNQLCECGSGKKYKKCCI